MQSDDPNTLEGIERPKEKDKEANQMEKGHDFEGEFNPVPYPYL